MCAKTLYLRKNVVCALGKNGGKTHIQKRPCWGRNAGVILQPLSPDADISNGKQHEMQLKSKTNETQMYKR